LDSVTRAVTTGIFQYSSSAQLRIPEFSSPPTQEKNK
jgi:hypothetical protein